MVWLKYMGGVLVVITLCNIIWFFHPAKVQLEEKVSILEEQVGGHYKDTINSLRVIVEQLLAWDFNQPATEEEEGTINELSEEFLDIILVLFLGNKNELVHSEWENRMYDVNWYLRDYLRGTSLSKEEIANLHQALQAIRFIAMDFNAFDGQTSYDAMHDDEHEMVERVKSRLSTEY